MERISNKLVKKKNGMTKYVNTESRRQERTKGNIKQMD